MSEASAGEGNQQHVRLLPRIRCQEAKLEIWCSCGLQVHIVLLLFQEAVKPVRAETEFTVE